MFRRLLRLAFALAGMTFILGAFALRAAPDILPPDKMRALHDALPYLYYEKPARTASRRDQRPPSTHTDSGIYAPPHRISGQSVTMTTESSERRLPLAQRKTLRVGD